MSDILKTEAEKKLFAKTLIKIVMLEPGLATELCSMMRQSKALKIAMDRNDAAGVRNETERIEIMLLNAIERVEGLESPSRDQRRRRFVVESIPGDGIVVKARSDEPADARAFVRSQLGVSPSGDRNEVTDAMIARGVVSRYGMDYRSARAMVDRMRRGMEEEARAKEAVRQHKDALVQIVEPNDDEIAAVAERLSISKSQARSRIIESRIRKLKTQRMKTLPEHIRNLLPLDKHGRYDAPLDLRTYLNDHKAHIPKSVRERVLTGQVRGDDAWSLLKMYVEN